MGGLPETHVMYHSTHITDIITDRDVVRHPSYQLKPQHHSASAHGINTKGRQHLFGYTTWPPYARDEEHFSLRDEANARTQLLQKIPLCGRPASLEAAHREDQGFGQGKDFRLCRFKKDTIDLTIEENPVTRFSSMDAGCRFREPYTSATPMGPV